MTWSRTLVSVIDGLKDSDADLAFLGRTDTQVVPHRELHGLLSGTATDLRRCGALLGTESLFNWSPTSITS